MSNLSLDFSDNTFQPLAARMRPENLAQYIGQQHLLAAGKPLPRAIEAGHLHSMILWGPPGTGKTDYVYWRDDRKPVLRAELGFAVTRPRVSPQILND